MNMNKTNINELIKYWESTLPPVVDYAEMIGAPSGYYGIQYVYDDPYGYYAEDTIAALKELQELREIRDTMLKDTHMFIGEWFLALEDEGCDPWETDDCVLMANKYNYTEKDYREFLRAII